VSKEQAQGKEGGSGNEKKEKDVSATTRGQGDKTHSCGVGGERLDLSLLSCSVRETGENVFCVQFLKRGDCKRENGSAEISFSSHKGSTKRTFGTCTG